MNDEFEKWFMGTKNGRPPDLRSRNDRREQAAFAAGQRSERERCAQTVERERDEGPADMTHAEFCDWLAAVIRDPKALS